MALASASPTSRCNRCRVVTNEMPLDRVAADNIQLTLWKSGRIVVRHSSGQLGRVVDRGDLLARRCRQRAGLPVR